VQAAEALEHAHAKAIIHRDIKPANLLIDSSGNLWITDFGLARMLSEAGLTMTGDLLGTLRYMSSEQALAKRVPVDHRTDIYSLGVTLYELVTLRPAYDGRDRQEVMQQIAFEEPRLPRRHNKAIPAELETIIRKAMGKSPAERYATAQELADDLRRFLDDKPIRAKRPTLIDWTRKWARRHQGIVATGIAGLIVAVGILAVSTWMILGAYRAEAKQRQVAVQEADRSRRLLYASDMNLAGRAWEAGDTARARSLLERQWPQAGQEDLRGFEWRYLWGLCRDRSRQTLRGHTGAITGLAFCSNGKTLVSSGDQTVRFWNIDSARHVKLVGNAIGPFALDRAAVGPLALDRDGKILAFAEWGNHAPRLWDVAARRELLALPHRREVYAVALAPDGKMLATGCEDGSLRLWDVATGREVGTLEGGFTDPVSQVVFSSDGTTIASGSSDGLIRLWNVAARRLSAVLKEHTAGITSLSFSPNPQLLASASRDSTVRLWDTASRRAERTLRLQGTALTSVAFSPDGRWLATGGGDGSVRLWDAAVRAGNAEMKQITTLRGHTATVTVLAFAPDGRQLASGGRDRTIKIWDIAAAPVPDILTGHHGGLSCGTFSPDGGMLAVADTHHKTVELWDTASRRRIAVLAGHTGRVWCVAFSPDGQTLASASDDCTVRLWEIASKKCLATWAYEEAGVNSVAFSPDGKLLATGCSVCETFQVWDIASGRLVEHLSTPHINASRVGFSPDGALLAVSSRNTVQLWDVATGRKRATFRHTAEIVCLAFAPDGGTLAAGDADGTVQLWDVVHGTEIAGRRGHASNVESVAFSPDGRRLATGGGDCSVKLWDFALLQEVTSLPGHDGPVHSVAFSPDGNTLATASADSTVRFWHAPSSSAPIPHPAEAPSVPADETIRLVSLNCWGEAVQATLHTEGNVHRVTITAVGDADWKPALKQLFEDLEEGATYTVRFRAKADAPRKVRLVGQIGEPDWHGIGLDREVSVSADWQRYEYEFQAKDVAAWSSIDFNLGQQTGTVWIADFTLTKRGK
jgi:WD40 repeat protein